MTSDLYTYQDMSSYNCPSADASCKGLQTSRSQQPIAAVSATEFPKSSLIKPMRPLTAYHIFFQIEREFIIQTTPGADADSSIHNHKSYQTDVPQRYQKIKLAQDWFAGPGKRAKRKHRKSHGKIGFLELSRVISQRWANLGEIDPETKEFVAGVAKRELDQYKKEIKDYEVLAKLVDGQVEDAVPVSEGSTTTPPVKRTGAKKAAKKAVSILPSPSVTSLKVSSSFTFEQPQQSYVFHRTLITPPTTPPPSELFFPSEFDIDSVFNDVLPDAAFSSAVSLEYSETTSVPDDHVDYSISYVDKAGHHIPSPSSSVCGGRKRSLSEESICDPLFELEVASDGLYENKQVKKRRTSLVSVGVADSAFYDLWA